MTLLLRDACRLNLLMDSSELLPEGFHFAARWTRDGYHPIRPRSRSSVSPIKYYFIDFGTSYRQSAENPDPHGHSIVGQDKTVPEFQQGELGLAYDPYKVDIYQLGSAVVKQIADVRGVRFLGRFVNLTKFAGQILWP